MKKVCVKKLFTEEAVQHAIAVRWIMFILLAGACFHFLYATIIPFARTQPKITISKNALNEALKPQHREILNDIITKINQAKKVDDQLNALRDIGRLSFEVPKYASIDLLFKTMKQNLIFLSDVSVDVFNQLLPALESLDASFTFLGNATIGLYKDKIKELHRKYRLLLLNKARESYGISEFYRRRNLLDQQERYFTFTQGLLYRLKDNNAEAKNLYQKIDKEQPVPFEERVKKAAVVSGLIPS